MSTDLYFWLALGAIVAFRLLCWRLRHRPVLKEDYWIGEARPDTRVDSPPISYRERLDWDARDHSVRRRGRVSDN